MISYIYCPDIVLTNDRLSNTIIRYSNMISNVSNTTFLIAKNNICNMPLSNDINYINNKRSEGSIGLIKKNIGLLFIKDQYIDNLVLAPIYNSEHICIYVSNMEEYNKYVNNKIVSFISSNCGCVKYFTDNKKIKSKFIQYFSPIDPNFVMKRSLLERRLQLSGYYSNFHSDFYSKMIKILKEINPDFEVKLIGYNLNNLIRKDLIDLYNESMFWIEVDNSMSFRVKDAILCGCIVFAPKENDYYKIAYTLSFDATKMAKKIADISYNMDNRGEMIYKKLNKLYPIDYSSKCLLLKNLLRK